MTGGAHMRWNVSIALRVARHAPEYLFSQSVFGIEGEGLTLPVCSEATFPPVIPHEPRAAILPLWRDAPPTDLGLTSQHGILRAVAGRHQACGAGQPLARWHGGGGFRWRGEPRALQGGAGRCVRQ